jgi:NADPH:quinone reductase-like Zn-dependent oxidoreductase
MRALELTYPWGTANLKMVERPDPTPGPGQVVVRMRAISLNYRDVIIAAQGGYTLYGEGSPPVVMFSDSCGIVEAVGDGVTRVAVGDRVSTLFFPNWIAGRPTPENSVGMLGVLGAPGAGRELALLSENAVSLVPEYLTDHEVSTLACAALTAWRALFVDARLEPGDTVVLQGTGGVSIFGLQFAHAAGYRTIITSSSDESWRARRRWARLSSSTTAPPQSGIVQCRKRLVAAAPSSSWKWAARERLSKALSPSAWAVISR